METIYINRKGYPMLMSEDVDLHAKDGGLESSIVKWKRIIKVLENPDVITLNYKKLAQFRSCVRHKCGLCLVTEKKLKDKGKDIYSMEDICLRCPLRQEYGSCLDEDSLFNDISELVRKFQDRPTKTKRIKILRLSRKMLKRLEDMK